MLEITLELKNTILDTFKIDKDEITRHVQNRQGRDHHRPEQHQ